MKSIKQFIFEAIKSSDRIISTERAIDEIASLIDSTIKCSDENKFISSCDKLLKYLQSEARPASVCPPKPCAFIYISKHTFSEGDADCLKYMSFGNYTDSRYSPTVECYIHKFAKYEFNKRITDSVTFTTNNIHEANFPEEFSSMKRNGYVFFVNTDIIEKCYPDYDSCGRGECVEKHVILKREDYVKYINKLTDFTVNPSQQKSLKDRLDKSIKSIETCALTDITEIENIEDKENWFVINLYPNKPKTKLEKDLYLLLQHSNLRKRHLNMRYYKFKGRRKSDYSGEYDRNMWVINWNDLLKLHVPKSFFDYSYYEWGCYVDNTECYPAGTDL